MKKITPSQIRKIYCLCRERGLDSETLHEHVLVLTKKESIKKLLISEAIKVIESLEGKPSVIEGMMTNSQIKYINGLIKEIGWVDESGKPDNLRLEAFVKERFKLFNMKWISSHKASQIIEALKAMSKRNKSAQAK